MNKKHYQAAKAHLVACMQQGQACQRASASAGLQISQSNAYRLWRVFRQHGEIAFSDGRHGHPSKLRGVARAFLEERCRETPQTPSSTIQMELRERFDLHVSISQINRVRPTLGISNHPKGQQEKKANKGSSFPQPEWQDGGGRPLLLATAHPTPRPPELHAALAPSPPTA